MAKAKQEEKRVSKVGSTRVPTEKLAEIVEQLGLEKQDRNGWFLAYNPEDKRKRLLVHTGKRGTNCIELVGFEAGDAAIEHPVPPARTMTQMLDCNLSEKEILANFKKAAKLLATGKAQAVNTEEGNEQRGEDARS